MLIHAMLCAWSTAQQTRLSESEVQRRILSQPAARGADQPLPGKPVLQLRDVLRRFSARGRVGRHVVLIYLCVCLFTCTIWQAEMSESDQPDNCLSGRGLDIPWRGCK